MSKNMSTPTLSGNHTLSHSVPVGVFSNLTRLEALYLHDNAIRVLPAGVFSHLTSLQDLWLYGNHIADLPDGVFSHLTSLQELWLYDNHIADLPDGVFSRLTSLVRLRLSKNNISSLPTGMFSHLTSLQFLWLYDNHISDLPDAVFSHLTSLQFLWLYDNHIADLPDEVFLHLTSLEGLDLSNNNISSLPTGVFSHLTSLQELDLSGNHIADLPDGVFSLVTSLEGLYLHNNNISSLPTGVFSNLTRLQYLLLSDNHIADLPDGVFSHLNSLEQLYLHNNNISSLPTGVFSHLTSLQGLQLSDNHIADLPDGVFSNLTSLEGLDLHNNNISSISTGVFSHLISVRYIYIAGNPWRCDCGLHSILTLPRLHDLIWDNPTCSSPPHMEGDALKSVKVDKVCQYRGDCTTGSAEGTCACNVRWTGQFCDKEANLALGKKASQSSTRDNGTGAEKAVDGSVTDCAVTNREHQPWWKVDLAGYFRVSRVTIGTFYSLSRDTLMVRVGPNEDFTRNGQCGRNYTVWYGVQTIEAHCDPPMYGRYVSVQAIPSAYPNETFLVLCEVEVYVTETCCNNTISITNGQITADSGFCSGDRIEFSCDPGYELVGSSVVFCQDNHWDREIPTCQLSSVITGSTIAGIATALIVGVVFFAVFLRRREDDDDVARPIEGSPKYDVFISYSSKESPWVNDSLLHDLNRNGYKICLDERDFVAGKPILTNIADAIYQSRKVILVMSKNFIKSGWCRHELNLAWARKLDRRENCVVVVKYDKCKIPRELAKLTYLDWTKQTGKKTFWDKFRQTGKKTFWDKLHESLGPARV